MFWVKNQNFPKGLVYGFAQKIEYFLTAIFRTKKKFVFWGSGWKRTLFRPEKLKKIHQIEIFKTG